MAEMTIFDVNDLLPGEPWTSAKAQGVYENLFAAMEGATDAPRLRGLAAATPDELPVLSVTATDDYVLGSTTNTIAEGALVTTNDNYVAARTITIVAVTGAVRFRASHRSDGSATIDLRLTKNGTAVATWDTNSATAVARSHDESVVPGDVLVWEHKGPGASIESTVSALSENASDGYTPQPILIAQSDK